MRPGRWNVTLEPVELDTRRLCMVACDIGELPGDDLVEELAASIEEQGGEPLPT